MGNHTQNMWFDIYVIPVYEIVWFAGVWSWTHVDREKKNSAYDDNKIFYFFLG